MQKINSATNLRNAILQLESKQADEEKKLSEQFLLVCDSLKPINLIKSTLKEVAASRDLKSKILNTSIGLTAGYFLKTLFERVSHSPFKRFFGTALLVGVTKIVAKTPDVIRSVRKRFLNIKQDKVL